MGKAIRVIASFASQSLAVLLLLAGCSTSLQTYSLLPARSGLALPQGSSLAVLDFEESYGDLTQPESLRRALMFELFNRNLPPDTAATERVNAALVGLRVNNQPFFTVVEREKIQQVLREKNLTSAGVQTGGGSAHSGQLVGADYLLTGSSNLNIHSTWEQIKHSQCRKYDEIEQECLDVLERTVRCEVRHVQLNLVPRLVDVGSSKILYSRKIDKSNWENACTQAYSPWTLSAPYEVLFYSNPLDQINRVVDEAVEEIKRDIAPYYAKVKLGLRTKISVQDSAAKKQFKFAMKLLRQDFEQGCGQLRMLTSGPASGDIALRFNIAICDELSGNLDTAQQTLEHLSTLYIESQQTPPRFVRTALDRVNKKVRDRAVLNQSLPTP